MVTSILLDWTKIQVYSQFPSTNITDIALVQTLHITLRRTLSIPMEGINIAIPKSYTNRIILTLMDNKHRQRKIFLNGWWTYIVMFFLQNLLVGWQQVPPPKKIRAKGQTFFFHGLCPPKSGKKVWPLTFDPYGSNKPSPKCQFENGKWSGLGLV